VITSRGYAHLGLAELMNEALNPQQLKINFYDNEEEIDG